MSTVELILRFAIGGFLYLGAIEGIYFDLTQPEWGRIVLTLGWLFLAYVVFPIKFKLPSYDAENSEDHESNNQT